MALKPRDERLNKYVKWAEGLAREAGIKDVVDDLKTRVSHD